jgi:hypothetical protein
MLLADWMVPIPFTGSSVIWWLALLALGVVLFLLVALVTLILWMFGAMSPREHER